jgi:hypothetical protein
MRSPLLPFVREFRYRTVSGAGSDGFRYELREDDSGFELEYDFSGPSDGTRRDPLAIVDALLRNGVPRVEVLEAIRMMRVHAMRRMVGEVMERKRAARAASYK